MAKKQIPLNDLVGKIIESVYLWRANPDYGLYNSGETWTRIALVFSDATTATTEIKLPYSYKPYTINCFGKILKYHYTYNKRFIIKTDMGKLSIYPQWIYPYEKFYCPLFFIANKIDGRCKWKNITNLK